MEYIVYVKVNDLDHVVAVNSSAFLTDTTDWVKIDSGYGDKYHHAQGNYFPESIITDGGAYRYKLMDGKVVACTDEEIENQENANADQIPSTIENRVETLESDSEEIKEALEMILSGVTE